MRLSLYSLILFLLTIGYSCTKVKHKINQAGDIVGQTTGEFASGVGSGVTKAFDINLPVPATLKQKGLSIGKILLTNDSVGVDNLLSVYMIFSRDFSENVTLKAYDQNGKEMGRSSLDIQAKQGTAGFYDFRFDRRTNIDHDSKIVME